MKLIIPLLPTYTIREFSSSFIFITVKFSDGKIKSKGLES